ncbi:hypothetical protein FRC02_000885 [Tulasnella sp. 418]|nr:hypothetical protein FRC02_000885 [Tulasnella sp. 418]
MANARYEDWASAQHSLMVGFGAGGGLDISNLNQTYRTTVLKHPPAGDFHCEVVPTLKQGSVWHYGCRVTPPHDSPSSSQEGYTIYRKWEDCLDLQKILEREFSFVSCNQRKLSKKAKTASTFYQVHQRAASFDSLPDGPDPINLALDIHTHLPKLSKKSSLFGKANANLLACRETEFKTFIEALFSIDMPLIQDVRGKRVVRDWFGYWRRDREAARKSGAPYIPGTMMAGLTPHLGLPEPLPGFINKRASVNSSVSGSSSSDGRARSFRSESGTGDEDMLDSFPITPEGLPFSLPHPTIHSSSSSSLFSSLSPTIAPTPPKPRSYDSPYLGGAFAVGGMMVPVGRSRSRSSRKSASSTPSYPSTPAEPVNQYHGHSSPMLRPGSNHGKPPMPLVPILPPAAVPVIKAPTNPGALRTPRQRPTGPAHSANRKGRVFVSSPDEETATEPSLHTPHASISISRTATDATLQQQLQPPASPTHGMISPDELSKALSAATTPTGNTLAAPKVTHHRRNSSSLDSFIDVKLPYTAPSTAEEEAVYTAPAVQSRTRRNRRSASRAAARHSISSIEAYLSDSSIDAAISKMRISGPTANAAVSAAVSGVTSTVVTPSGLKRSFSSGSSSRPNRNSFIESGDMVLEEPTTTGQAEGGGQVLEVPVTRGHDSFIDSYFYSPNSAKRNSAKASHRLSTQTHSSIATDTSDILGGVDDRRESLTTHLASKGHFQVPWAPSSEAGHTSSSGSQYSRPSSPQRYGCTGDNCFAVKCTIPAALDSAAVVCRIPRSTTFEELQEKLQAKFEEAEGISLRRFSIGVAPSPYSYGRSLSSKTNSISSSIYPPPSPIVPTGRMRSGSVVSSTGSMIDPSSLTIIKNQAEWEATIPGAHEKLTLHILVDE